MDKAELALILAIAGLAVSLGHLLLNLFIWNRSGGRLTVRRLKLEMHPYDPMQHQVVLEVVNGGRLPVRVKGIGVSDEVSDSAGGTGRPYITLDAEPEGGPLPRVLNPGDLLTAKIPMTAIVERWFADGHVKLRGWAQREDGRRKSSSLLLDLETPARPPTRPTRD